MKWWGLFGASCCLVFTASPSTAQETCQVPIVVPGFGGFAGDTTGSIDDYNPGPGGCTGVDASGPDHIVQYTPAAGELVDIVLTPTAADYDPSLWVFTACGASPVPESSCVAGADRHGRGVAEKIEFLPLTGATPYYVAIDGYDDLPFGHPWGPYIFELRASVIPDDCPAAREVLMLPAADALDTSIGTATLDPAPGCGLASQPGPDLVYVVDPPYAAALTVVVSPAGFNGSLYAVTECAQPAATCVAGSDVAGVGGAETIMLTTTPGTPTYVVVDSPDAGGGAYEIRFIVGEDCAAPVLVDALPFTAEGDSSAASNDIDLSTTACTGWRTRSPDVVYEIRSAADVYVDILLEPINLAVDGSLYVVTDCAQPDATCVAGADKGGEGAPELLRAMLVPAGQPYYVVVDSATFDAGLYRITITASDRTLLYAVRDPGGVRLRFTGTSANYEIARSEDEQFTVNLTVLDPAAPGPELLDASATGSMLFYRATGN